MMHRTVKGEGGLNLWRVRLNERRLLVQFFYARKTKILGSKTRFLYA